MNSPFREIEKPKVLAPSRSLVAQFANMESVRGDRDLKESRLLAYSKAIENKTMRSLDWAK